MKTVTNILVNCLQNHRILIYELDLNWVFKQCDLNEVLEIQILIFFIGLGCQM